MAKSEEMVMVPRYKLERVRRLAREHGENLKRGAADLDRSVKLVDQLLEGVEERRREDRRRSY